MRGEGQKRIAGKTARWESELWSYLSRGDGVNCPLHHDCELRQNGGLCLDDHRDRLHKLYGNIPFNPGDEAESLNFLLKSIEYDYLRNWKPGPIFQLVERLADKYIEKSHIDRPPVPNKIIDVLDIDRPVEIRPVSLKAYQGAVWYTDDTWVIQLNEKQPIESKRITLFHEIFHVIAHIKSTPIFKRRGTQEGFFNEFLADYFAGCILIPQKLVVEKWAEVKELKRMAEIFQVTQLTMWFRLKTMGLL